MAAQINMYQAKVFFYIILDKLIQIRYLKNSKRNSRNQKKIQLTEKKRNNHKRKLKDITASMINKDKLNKKYMIFFLNFVFL